MEAPVYEIKEVFEIKDKNPVRYRRLRFIVGHEDKTCFMFPQYMFKNNMRLACKNMCSKNKCKAAISLKLIDEIQNIKVDKPHAYELPPTVPTELLKKTDTYAIIPHKVSNWHSLVCGNFYVNKGKCPYSVSSLYVLYLLNLYWT